MNIEQAKRIPLEDVLLRLGHAPQRQGRGQLWYLSPFRPEHTPSFKVNGGANLWYDFGEGQGGDILDLVMRLERLGSVSETLSRLDQLMATAAPPPPGRALPPQREPQPETEITHIGPVKSHSLLEYLKQRGIDRKLATPFLKEVHYRRGQRSYFALGFASDGGGMELRSPRFKGTLGPKEMTFIPGNPERVLVFEGFFDFLTAVTLSHGAADATVIVLNSAALQEKAAERIRELAPRVVELYRDRDAAGERLLRFFQEALSATEIRDQSALYSGHKDLNAWHVATWARSLAGSACPAHSMG
jgi:DNA primase